MWTRFVDLLVILSIYVFPLSIAKYRFTIENDELLDPCRNSSAEVVDFNGMADLTDLSITQTWDGFHVEGNVTYIWDIQPGDRVQAHFYLLRFDRGAWLPTPLTMVVHNICEVLFDKRQYWYKFWSQHVINKKEVKHECFYPGIQHIFEPFDVSIVFENTGIPLSGRHQLVLEYNAFDASGKPRKNKVCMQITGTIERLKK